MSLLSKFGMAAGVNVNYFTPKLDGLNDKLTKAGLPEFSKGIFTYGGSGYVYVLFVRNLRFGGIGFGGSQTVADGNKSAKLTLSGGGVTVEYTLPQVRSFALSFGAIIGGGKLSLDLYDKTSSMNWDDVWNEYEGDAEAKHIDISSSYFLFAPTVNAEFLLSRLIAFRVGIGYQFAIAENWEVYNEQNLNNVPSNFSGNGFFANVGILIGLFVF